MAISKTNENVVISFVRSEKVVLKKRFISSYFMLVVSSFAN